MRTVSFYVLSQSLETKADERVAASVKVRLDLSRKTRRPSSKAHVLTRSLDMDMVSHSTPISGLHRPKERLICVS